MNFAKDADQDFLQRIQSDLKLAEAYSRRAREYHEQGDLEMADYLRTKLEDIFDRLEKTYGSL